MENPKNREMSYEVASSNKRVYVWDVAAEKVQVRWSMMEHGRYGCCFFTKNRLCIGLPPRPVTVGNKGFQGSPTKRYNDPGGGTTRGMQYFMVRY